MVKNYLHKVITEDEIIIEDNINKEQQLKDQCLEDLFIEQQPNDQYLEDLFIEHKKNYDLHRYIFEKNLIEVTSLLSKFPNKKQVKELVNQIDIRGNTPLFLAIYLKNSKKDDDYLRIIEFLLKNYADPKISNDFILSPIDQAILNKDSSSLLLIMDAIFLRKSKKLMKRKDKISEILISASDFYFEMKWEFDSIVPFLSKVAPSDTCNIWKVGDNIRMDSTFEDFKGLKTLRLPKSFIFRKRDGEREVFNVNWQEKSYFNPLEPLDEEEKLLVISDILNDQNLKGEFAIKECSINESKSMFGKLQFEKVNEWNSQKYDINITSSLNIHNRHKLEYTNIDKELYFDEKKRIQFNFKEILNLKDVKSSLIDKGLTGVTVEKEALRQSMMKSLENGNKKMKANVWIANNFPISSMHLVNLVNSMGNANEYMSKLKEFFENKDIKSIIDKNGFPIKLKIPITFFLDIVITFCKYKDINEKNEEIKELFEIPSNFIKETRKKAQNLNENEKKRILFSKFAI